MGVVNVNGPDAVWGLTVLVGIVGVIAIAGVIW